MEIPEISAALEENGYAVVSKVIPPELADEARSIVEDILAEEQTDTHASSATQRVGRLAVKDRVFLDLMCHPRVVAFWKSWLGEDMMCSTWTSNTLYPGHTTLGWHSDHPYWTLSKPWPEGQFAGQTIWMLDDFTPENGATAVVPGSHKLLRPPENIRVWNPDGEILIGSKGSVVFMHGATWHTARPNTTSIPRTCLLGMYIRPHCLPQENMRGQLADIPDPAPLVEQLMGGNQRQPQDITG